MTTARTAENTRLRLTRPAVFGAFDGCASLIGVVVYLAATHPALIFPAAVSGALTSAVSMGGGEFLSDSDLGLAASLVMALATFTGALAPAIPFAFGHGTAAIAGCVAICAAVILVVARLRPNRGRGLALAETAGLFAAAVIVALACARLLPGGSA
jgi:VIT1/CCC1 family predicted Fe2+/Mn2+ transporter